MAKLSGWLLAAGLLGFIPQTASADSRIYNVAPYGANIVPFGAPPAVIYDRAEGLFYRVPPYYYSRYYGLDPYAWHYRNAGRYGQPYYEGQYRPRPHIRSAPPSAAIYQRPPEAPVDTRRLGEPPQSVPSTPAPKLNQSPQQKAPDVDL
ncbi:MAG: hypothetical protein ACXWJW_09915 [Xanthobacteraceae bacterium]